MDLNLDTLKREILEYLESTGFAVFRSGPGGLDELPMVAWDTETHPDYQMYLDVALKTDSKVIIFGSREFETSDIDELLAHVDDLELTRDQKRDLQRRLREFRGHEGSTCTIEMAFDYHSRLYVYEMQPDWYDEFLTVEDEVLGFIADESMGDDEDEPLGGYYSKN